MKCENINASISYVLYFNECKYKSRAKSSTVAFFVCYLLDVIQLDALVEGNETCMQLCNALALGKAKESLLRLRIKRLQIDSTKSSKSAALLDLVDHKVHGRDHRRMR